MTTERVRSVAILIATLIVGILLGLLVPGFFHKMGGRHEGGRPKESMHDNGKKGDWLAHMLDRVIEPDSVQRKKMQPVTAWASSRLDSLDARANVQASQVLDSVKFKLKPMLTDAQWERLDKFDRQAKSRWHGRGNGRGGRGH